jgi:hypothetical protein
MPALKKVKSPQRPTMIMVTPTMAAKWLEANVHNRKISQEVVDRYTREMKAGSWHLNHQGIAFNCEGTLIDGQHRLWAVIESGCTIPMLVMEGLPLESQLTIDCNFARDLAARLSLTDKYGTVSKDAGAVLLRLVRGCKTGKKLGTTEEEALYAKHHKAVEFALGVFPRKRNRVTTIAAKAVIARAFYSPYDNEEIARFAEIMVTGEAKAKKDQSVLRMVESLQRGRKGGAPFNTYETYDRVQRYLQAWLNGRTLGQYTPSRIPTNMFRLKDEVMGRAMTTAGPKTSRVLDYFQRHKTVTTAEIAKALRISPSDANTSIGIAKKAGWVKQKTRARGNKPAVWEYVERS